MKKHLGLIIFLLAYFAYVLFSYRSFGITWDEQAVYERGKMLYQHLVDPNRPTDPNLLIRKSDNDVWPTYNNTYAMTLYAFNKDKSYDIYHLENLIFASSIFVFAYVFLYKKYRSTWAAVLGPLFIVMSPRFFGDLPANPKDMPFAVFYFISTVLIYLTHSFKNVLWRVLTLGILFGLAQTTRSLGFSLYILLFVYDFLKRDKKTGLLKFITSEALLVFMVFVTSNMVVLLTWPYIASNYFKNFIDVLNVSKQFPWMRTIFFLGRNYHSTELTPFYIPIWFLVSLPVFIIAGTVASLLIVKRFIKNEIFLLSVGALLLNMAMYFVMKPIVYDGVRHFLFLIPFFSILTAIFVIEISKSGFERIKKAVYVFVILNCFLVVVAQVKLFPYTYIYFNEFVGGVKGASKYFEIDYWNASFKENVEWLKENELIEGKEYSIYTCSTSLSILNYFTNEMTVVHKASEADYAVCLTRGNEYKKIPGKIINVVTRDSVPLNYAIKVDKSQ